MKRSFWFVAGAGAGVYVMARARRLAEAFTADGLRDRASAAVAGLLAFREDVAAGQAEKETELRQRFGLVADRTPQLEGGLDTGSLRSPGSTTEDGSGGLDTGSLRSPGSTTEIDKDGRT